MKNQNSSKTKALVLFSGGLDSRLAVKLLQEQGIETESVFFLLPFIKQNIPEIKNINMHIIDCTKGNFLKEYLNLIQHPKFGHGAGINPCIDCKIFMLKKAKEYADKNKINIIATGEVLGQRPMSQTENAIKKIDSEIDFKIKRPLAEINISGRQRKKQIELAKKYNINYHGSGGGCILCEHEIAKRIKFLLEKNLINEKTLQLAKIGRHFLISDCWFVIARNEPECFIIENQKKSNFIESEKSKPAVYFYKKTKKTKVIAEKLQEAYSKSGNEKLKKDFEKYKI